MFASDKTPIDCTKTYISGDKLILPDPDLRGKEGEYTITLYPFVATNGREIVAGYGYRVHELGYFKAVALSFEDLEELPKINRLIITGKDGGFDLDLNSPPYRGVKKTVDRIAKGLTRRGKPKSLREVALAYLWAESVMRENMGRN